MPKRLTDEEREHKRKERNRKVLENYKRHNGSKGSTEKWKQIAEMFLRHTTDTDISIALKDLKIKALPSSLKELNKIWKKRMIEAHPDKGGNVKEASAVNNAYVLLKTFFDEPVIDAPAPAKAKAKETASAPANGLIEPSRCTASLPDDLEQDYLVGELKIDGSRYVLYIGNDPYKRHDGNTLLSRRVSVKDNKYVDRTENVPHITSATYRGLEGTVLDGEIVSEDFLATNSIMNSLPETAIQKQKELGLLKYHVFDCPVFCGKDIRELPLSERRKKLEEVVKKMGNPHVITIKQVKGDLHGFFKRVTDKGGEGIVVKDIRKGYGIGWAKYKKSYDVSCIITGWKPGKGKYQNKVGSLAVSVYKDGKLVEVGYASGFDDAVRDDMTQNWKKYEGKIVDIFAQEIGTDRLRHPTFHRIRTDLDPRTITMEKLLGDLKKKVKGKRE